MQIRFQNTPIGDCGFSVRLSFLFVLLISVGWNSSAEAGPVVPERMGVLWHRQIAPPAFLEYSPSERSTPAFDSARGLVFVADRFGVLRAFDSLGQMRWEADLGGTVEAGLLVRDDRLYAATLRGRVYCFDAATGRQIWMYKGTNEFATTPTMSDGRLFLAGLSDTLLVLDAEDGEFIWFHRRPRPENLTIRGAAPAAVAGHLVVTAFSDGTVVALDVSDGNLLWSAKVGNGEYQDVNAAPIVRENKVFLASFSGALHALDLQSGREIWTVPGLDGATRMVTAKDRLILAAPGHVVAHRISDGVRLWETAMKPGVPSDITIRGDLLAVGTEEGPLVVLSVFNGRPTFAFDSGKGIGGGAALDAQGMWLLTNSGRLFRLAWPG